jgi:type I restriction enzyme, S subunit
MRINNSQLPSEWQIVSIDKIANKVTDGEHLTPERSESGVLLLSARNVQNGFLSLKEVDYVPEHEYQRIIKRCNPEYRDVLISCSGTIGRVCIVPDNLKFTLVRSAALIKPGKQVNSDFLGHVLRSSFVQNQISRALNQSAQANLFINHINSLVIPLPPLREQCRIAEILGIWDESIDLLEKLIASKRKLKQGLIQKLLTGKKRFKKFKESAWQPKILIEIAEVLVSPVDKLIVDGEKSIYLCNYTDVYKNNRITQSISFMEATATEREIAKFTLKKDDVIITKDSESPTDIAVPAYVSEDLEDVVCGYHLAILRPRENKICGEYLSYILSSPEIRYYFFTLANGATRFGLSVGSIEKAKFNLPSLPEQEKIASVLSAADAEISTLERQLAAYKQQKCGLMQQLLTGRVKVLELEDEQD